LGKVDRARQIWDILTKPEDSPAPASKPVGGRKKKTPPSPTPVLTPIPGLEPMPPSSPPPPIPASASGSETTPILSKSAAYACTNIIKAWLFSASERALGAYMRGDDRLAYPSAGGLAAAIPPLRKQVENLFSDPEPFNGVQAATSELRFFDFVPTLAAELGRREKEKGRVPVKVQPMDGIERIQDMIRRLEDIESDSGWRVGFYGGDLTEDNPSVQALIAEGEDAVEPLLDCLEHDPRLTRTVITSERPAYRGLVGVDKAAFLAISGILKPVFVTYNLRPNDLKGRAALAADIRKYWMAHKGLSTADRWFAVLANDAAEPKNWVEDAKHIIYTIEGAEGQHGIWARFFAQLHIQKREIAAIAKLRAKTDPSVSDLLKRRMMEIANMPADPWGRNAVMATDLAKALKEWDGKAEVKALHDLCRVLFKVVKENAPDETGLVARDQLSRLATDVIALGDTSMIDDYAQWLRDRVPLPPKPPENNQDDHFVNWFEPMWRNPDSAIFQETASYLFTDGRSPWPNYIKSWVWVGGSGARKLIASPLLGLRGFREMVLSGLADRSAIGVPSDVGMNPADPSAAHQAVNGTFRVCDLYAWELRALQPMPALEIYWPEKQRDAAIDKCAEILRQYGERYRFSTLNPKAETPDSIPNPMVFTVADNLKALMSFPRLDHPATDADVKAGAAIFALPESANAKRWPMRQFPMTARLKTPNGSGDRDSNTGFVWQAEEGMMGGRRQLFFGFCGKPGVMRVPADQLEFPGGYSWWKIADRLEYKFAFKGETTDLGSMVNAPLILTLSFRNMDATHSIDLKTLFPSSGTLRLYNTKNANNGKSIKDVLGPELKPTRSTELELPAMRQILDPLTETQIMEVHLHDHFSITQPGAYHVEVLFGSPKRESKRNPIWEMMELELE
jgi:hypothetical protein